MSESENKPKILAEDENVSTEQSLPKPDEENTEQTEREQAEPKPAEPELSSTNTKGRFSFLSRFFSFLKTPKVMRIRESSVLNLVFCLLVPLITLVCLEWIARGTLGIHQQGNGFFQAFFHHFPSFLVAYILLMFLYIFLSHLSGWYWLATLVTGVVGVVPAVVTYYKLNLRNEPFLPWDLMQISELTRISDSVNLIIQPSMVVTILLFAVLTILSLFVRLPRKIDGKRDWKTQLSLVGVSAAGILLLMFGIFLSPSGTSAIGVKEDMWMQDRYYRTNGVLTGFLTNLQMLKIDAPNGYNRDAIVDIAKATEEREKDEDPLYDNAPAQTGDFSQETPDIIFLMAESFWDMTRLPGIEYDRELLTNYTELSEQGASGMAYTPSFGGGTCDVEFEALTGFSVNNLPLGSKPYQQYVTQDTFSLPQVLKDRGYETMAIHGYGRRFWNRDKAYPRLGIDTFIASDEFTSPHTRRGFISDRAMVDRIIEEHSSRASDDNPMFIHAVTMQNHTTYDRSRYPASDLVHVTEHPTALRDNTISQMEDCATGIYEMDQALGRLTEYLETTDRPTILVFWGDHMNPMLDGLGIFEETGFIDADDSASPALHQTPLLIWSNMSQNQIDLGIVATYDLSPLVMELYGLEKPLYFEFLRQEMDVLRVQTHGVTVNPDNSIQFEMEEDQAEVNHEQWMLQYDYMFGSGYLEEYLNTGS